MFSSGASLTKLDVVASGTISAVSFNLYPYLFYYAAIYSATDGGDFSITMFCVSKTRVENRTRIYDFQMLYHNFF